MCADHAGVRAAVCCPAPISDGAEEQRIRSAAEPQCGDHDLLSDHPVPGGGATTE